MEAAAPYLCALISSPQSSTGTIGSEAAAAIAAAVRNVPARFSRLITHTVQLLREFPRAAIYDACASLADIPTNDARVSLDLLLRALTEMPGVSVEPEAPSSLHRLFSLLVGSHATSSDVYFAAAFRLASASVKPRDASALVSAATPALIEQLAVDAQLKVSEVSFSNSREALEIKRNLTANEITRRRDAVRRLCMLAKLILAVNSEISNAHAGTLAAAAIAQGTSATLIEDIVMGLLPRPSAILALQAALARVSGRASQQLEAAMTRLVASTNPTLPSSALSGSVPAVLVSAIFGEGRTVFSRPGRPLRRPAREDEDEHSFETAPPASSLACLLGQNRESLSASMAARSAAYAAVPGWRARSVRHAAITMRNIPLALAYCGADAGSQQSLFIALTATRRFAEARGVVRTLVRSGRMNCANSDVALQGIRAAEAGSSLKPSSMSLPSTTSVWEVDLQLVGQDFSDFDDESLLGVKTCATMTFVTTVAGVLSFSRALSMALSRSGGSLIVGLDAEWRPSGSDSLVPVSLLQVATRSHCWVIDVHQLREEEALRAALLVLSRPELVCTGWGLIGDLKRLSRTVMGLRGARFRALDLSRLPRSSGAQGLSQVVEKYLGAPLDKSLQTSDWAERPLSWSQLSYAALDALAAARVVESACRQDGDLPLPEEFAFDHTDVDADLTAATAIVKLGAPAVADALTRAGLDSRQILVQRSHAAPPIASSIEVKTIILLDSKNRLVVAVLPAASTLDLVRLASLVSHFACGEIRLAARIGECAARCGFDPGVIPPIGLLEDPVATIVDSHIAATTDRVMAGGGDSLFMALFSSGNDLLRAVGAPIVADICNGVVTTSLPPLEGASSPLATASAAEPEFDIPRVKFLIDSSLNRLTRWLRAIGVDAEARDGLGAAAWHVTSKGSPASNSFLNIDDLIQYANEDGRIILSRDAKTLARRDTAVIFWVEDADIQTAFAAVCDAFSITVRPSDLMSRCSACNGGEYVQETAEEVRLQREAVSESILNRLTRFWRCTRCRKLYWEGGKFEESRVKFAELFQDDDK